MQEQILDELAAMSRHFYRLIDPRVSTRAQADAVSKMADAVYSALESLYRLDEASRAQLTERMRAVSAEVMAARPPRTR
jgi:hypothetical protein